ncbi:ParA family protein [Pyxidicoccus sp. MSG2]|uniref:ParA family protein n=1 Tax=Pyxidicoccus sp. MSG2 TaxID=2996790 RepID=UPI002271C152|nr:ParA family protein [Pyxidicoccus sp. MSG2]MCY1023936.1 ParA family protein [Pyxidicoccus sp. MSG2]
MGRSKRIAVLNEKGGSGKTTTAVNCAAALAQGGSRVLLVDLDPQCNATACVGLAHLVKQKGGYGTAEFVLGEGEFSPQRAQLGLAGLDVVPAMKSTSPLLEMRLLENHMSGNQKLVRALGRVDEEYDWIIVDCPPNLGMLAINAVNACRNVLVPIELSPLAAFGAVALRTFVEKVRLDLESRAQILGVLGTFNSRQTVRRQALEQVQQIFGALVFKTVIDEATAIRAASGEGKPIVLLEPEHKGSQQYMSLVEEVVSRAKY